MKNNLPKRPNELIKNLDIEYPEADKPPVLINLSDQAGKESIFG